MENRGRPRLDDQRRQRGRTQASPSVVIRCLVEFVSKI